MRVIALVWLILFFTSFKTIPLHEPDGKCHKPYKNPNDCRHPCDHQLCDCVKKDSDNLNKCMEIWGKCTNECTKKEKNELFTKKNTFYRHNEL